MDSEYSSGNEMPALLPGYHFTISFTETLCDQEQLDAIQSRLIEFAGSLIHEHNLRAADGRLIKTRLALYRTTPLRDEAAIAEERESISE